MKTAVRVGPMCIYNSLALDPITKDLAFPIPPFRRLRDIPLNSDKVQGGAFFMGLYFIRILLRRSVIP